MAKKNYLDVDTTDDFLDKPSIRYSDGTESLRGERLDRYLEAVKRGEITLPKLPPPTEH